MLNVTMSPRSREKLRERKCYIVEAANQISMYNVYNKPLFELIYTENADEIIVLTEDSAWYTMYASICVEDADNGDPLKTKVKLSRSEWDVYNRPMHAKSMTIYLI